MLIQRSSTNAIRHTLKTQKPVQTVGATDSFSLSDRDVQSTPSRLDISAVFLGSSNDSKLEPTQQDRLGEKHFRPGAPERYWLHPLGEPGERFWMPGSVKQTDGAPIKGAKVEFWVANDAGEYSEDDFAGRGWQSTDESGSFQLHSIRPSASEEKTAAYINLRVSAPGYESLSTRLFFEDDIYNPKDPGFHKDRELELGSLHWGKFKYFTADKDLILKKEN